MSTCADGLSMILPGELEVIAAVPGEGDEEDGYDGKEGMMAGIHGCIEEEGRYSTDPTQHPNMPMHLEEIGDRRVAVILKNSILILCMIRLLAFTLSLAHNRRLARLLSSSPSEPTASPSLSQLALQKV